MASSQRNGAHYQNQRKKINEAAKIDYEEKRIDGLINDIAIRLFSDYLEKKQCREPPFICSRKLPGR